MVAGLLIPLTLSNASLVKIPRSKMWCLGLYTIGQEVHPTTHVEILDGTIGEFVTDYLAKNGLRIENIGKLSVNNSVQFSGLSDQSWGIRLPFIFKLLAQVEGKG